MKQYHLNRQRAVRQFKKHAAEDNRPIQMVFPLAEIVPKLQQGVKQLIAMLLQQTIKETMQNTQGRAEHRDVVGTGSSKIEEAVGLGSHWPLPS